MGSIVILCEPIWRVTLSIPQLNGPERLRRAIIYLRCKIILSQSKKPQTRYEDKKVYAPKNQRIAHDDLLGFNLLNRACLF